MDMKLSGTRIKELRLKLSWSQEKLAEEAGLNPRTVQRVETDGSASLRTRLQLAQALRVMPEELNAEPGPTPELKARPEAASIYYIAILLLVSVVYLASQPAWFSLSIANYSRVGFSHGKPWEELAAWWTITGLLWAIVSVPVLLRIYRRHRSLFTPYLIGLFAGLGLAIIRDWQHQFVAELLTSLLPIGGMGLLVSLYIPRLNTALIRHGVLLSLSAYVVIWSFQVVGYSMLALWSRISMQGMRISLHGLGKPQYSNFHVEMLAQALDHMLPLIPLVLVILLSLAKRPTISWPTSGYPPREQMS